LAGTDAFEALDWKSAKRRKDEREDREELRRLIVEAMDPKAIEPVVMVASERVARLSTGTEFYVPQNINFAQLVKDITAAVVGQVQMGVRSPPPERPLRLTRKQRKDDDEILLLF
jgi:hypothetical protein